MFSSRKTENGFSVARPTRCVCCSEDITPCSFHCSNRVRIVIGEKLASFGKIRLRSDVLRRRRSSTVESQAAAAATERPTAEHGKESGRETFTIRTSNIRRQTSGADDTIWVLSVRGTVHVDWQNTTIGTVLKRSGSSSKKRIFSSSNISSRRRSLPVRSVDPESSPYRPHPISPRANGPERIGQT